MKKNIRIDRDSFIESEGRNIGVIADISISGESMEAINQAVEYCKSNNIDIDTSMRIIKYAIETSTVNVIVSAGRRGEDK